MTTLVFDIGGTNMRMAMGRGSQLAHITKIPTPQDPSEAVAALKNFAKDTEVKKVGGGIAGIVSGGVLVRAPNLSSWEGFDIQKSIEHVFSVPVVVLNDAAVEALGEAHEGAGKGHRIVAYVSVGTGAGGALITDGHLAPHTDGFEPGHQIIDYEKGLTLEQLVGGGSMRQELGRSAEMLPQSVYDARTRALAAGLHNTLRHWSPDVLVLGGSMIGREPGFTLARIEEELDSFSDGRRVPPVFLATLGDRAGLTGALTLTQ